MTPAVSVIIPTRNRADILKDTLPIFLDQDSRVAATYEVVIVDDDSPRRHRGRAGRPLGRDPSPG